MRGPGVLHFLGGMDQDLNEDTTTLFKYVHELKYVRKKYHQSTGRETVSSRSCLSFMRLEVYGVSFESELVCESPARSYSARIYSACALNEAEGLLNSGL